jgi:hypothetical protein
LWPSSEQANAHHVVHATRFKGKAHVFSTQKTFEREIRQVSNNENNLKRPVSRLKTQALQIWENLRLKCSPMPKLEKKRRFKELSVSF